MVVRVVCGGACESCFGGGWLCGDLVCGWVVLVMEMGACRLGVGREVGNAAGFGSLVALWLLEEKSEGTAVMMLERFGAAGI